MTPLRTIFQFYKGKFISQTNTILKSTVSQCWIVGTDFFKMILGKHVCLGGQKNSGGIDRGWCHDKITTFKPASQILLNIGNGWAKLGIKFFTNVYAGKNTEKGNNFMLRKPLKFFFSLKLLAVFITPIWFISGNYCLCKFAFRWNEDM